MDHLASTIRRHPVTASYILAFVLSWLGWFPQALYGRGLFPFDHPLLSLLGGVGPTLAAIIVTLVSKEGDGIRKLFGPLFALRASFWWFAFAFGFWISVIIDPYGRITAAAVTPGGDKTGQVVIADVPLGSGDSVAVRLGDWTGWLALAGMAFFIVYDPVTKARARRK